MRAPTPLGSAIQHALPSLFCLILSRLAEQPSNGKKRRVRRERKREREREEESFSLASLALFALAMPEDVWIVYTPRRRSRGI